MPKTWNTQQDSRTYEDGEELGCPDCAAGLEHCCPFGWADDQDEPARSWVLDHMRTALQQDT